MENHSPSSPKQQPSWMPSLKITGVEDIGHQSQSSDHVQYTQPPPTMFNQPPPSNLSELTDLNMALFHDPNDATRNPRYKTEICRNFKERGRCIYGDECQFAHGRRELRDSARNNKYKTKLCQKFWSVGFYCAYGPRCNFLHDEDHNMSQAAVIELFMSSQSGSLGHRLQDNYLNPGSRSISKAPSPVSLIEMEDLGSLDHLMASASNYENVSNYFFEPIDFGQSSSTQSSTTEKD